MQKIDGEKFQFIMPTGMSETVERIAIRHGHSKAETIRILIDIGLDVYEAFAATGVFKLHDIYEKAKETIKDSIGTRKLFSK